MKNADRTAATRARLIACARDLFAAQGYAGTATETILGRAGVTRGAMYHHFADKAALFAAVCEGLSAEASAEVARAAAAMPGRLDGLIAGSVAWVGFMLRDEARQILLVDAPGILGMAEWYRLDATTSAGQLAQGLQEARDAGEIDWPGDVTQLTQMVNGALNGLALGLGRGAAGDWPDAVALLLRRLLAGARPAPAR